MVSHDTNHMTSMGEVHGDHLTLISGLLTFATKSTTAPPTTTYRITRQCSYYSRNQNQCPRIRL